MLPRIATGGLDRMRTVAQRALWVAGNRDVLCGLWGHHFQSRGDLLVERKRPTASDDVPNRQPNPDRLAAPDVLTRAEARALSRSAPLTPSEFKAKRRVAEQRIDPLPTLLQGGDRTARDRGRPGSARG